MSIRAYRVQGRNNMLGAFYTSTGQQESITGDQSYLSVELYHSKIYTIDSSITLKLSNGIQDGQLKCVTFVHQGVLDANITLDVPGLLGTDTQVDFINLGDTLLLMWDGKAWTVLYTLNTIDPSYQTPIVT